MKKWGISGVTILTPDSKIEGSKIIINNSSIERITQDDVKTPVSIEIDNGVLTPGLINSHDHLLGTYYPKVGSGPYENWLPWDNDLKSSPIYEERQQIENRDLYLLGGYRSLISGATTVSDHIPHFVSEPFVDLLPVKVIKNYALAHSIASFALEWGDGIEIEYKKAIDENIPFITHISEGFDQETVNDIQTLDQKGGLGDHSVLIHGLAFSDEDIKLIKKRGASVVWCADSNMFMFKRTTNIQKLLDTGVNICIGTDSPMSGGENILSEMKYDRILYNKLYNKELKDQQILKMTTENPAKAFRLGKTGQIKDGYIADMVVFANNKNTPYDSVVSAGMKDIQLVIIDGKPAYGNQEYSHFFDSLEIEYQNISVDGVKKIIIGDVIGLIKRIERAVGYKKKFPFLPIEFD
ncbi:MAG: amidohydrolase family protein [Spirochaetota bacterium]|nr:amidohydrolase family protein [Spirochaetota bacterium]